MRRLRLYVYGADNTHLDESDTKKTPESDDYETRADVQGYS